MSVRLSPGDVLAGRYKVEEPLGKGGMGVVFMARHVRLGRKVAIKVLSESLSKSPDHIARFEREARIAAQIGSEHIVEVWDIGETDSGAIFLVMELLAGHDLDEELEQRVKLPMAQAVDIMLQACAGLAAAHGADLIHRDIKPANIFLAEKPGRESPLVKVVDFGLTKDLVDQSLTQTDSMMGTPQYMPPEQIRSSRSVDALSDQYAVAVVLWETMTGVPPFNGNSPPDILQEVLSKPLPPAIAQGADMNPALDEVLARAASKDPSQRYEDIAAFAYALAPFASPANRRFADRAARAMGKPTQDVVVVDDAATNKLSEAQQARARRALEARKAANPSREAAKSGSSGGDFDRTQALPSSAGRRSSHSFGVAGTVASDESDDGVPPGDSSTLVSDGLTSTPPAQPNPPPVISAPPPPASDVHPLPRASGANVSKGAKSGSSFLLYVVVALVAAGITAALVRL